MENITDIRESLLLQLRVKGADTAFCREMVESYCKFAELEVAMWQDVSDNGKTIKLNSSTGKVAERENPAVKMAVMCNKQRLEILKRLNLTVDNIVMSENETDI